MQINVKRTERELETLRKHLKGNITLENGIYSLGISHDLGEGEVRCICFNRFMTSMEIDITLQKNTLITLGTAETDVLYFMYALNGNSSLKFNDDHEFTAIEPLRPIVVSSNKEITTHLLVQQDERFHFNLIRIDRTRYIEKFIGDFHGLDVKLKDLLEVFDQKNERYHLGHHNLKIGELLKELGHSTRNNDLSSLLQFEGISNLILSDQIAQFFKEMKSEGISTSLCQRELRTVEELSDYIRNYPEIQHTVKDLCEKGGISSAKLQEGFKLMHGQTVSNYIRDIRLIKAEQLIRTSDFNISEVVYTIGLTSRSYFCKIFKIKYHCSPKEYRKKANFKTIV